MLLIRRIEIEQRLIEQAQQLRWLESRNSALENAAQDDVVIRAEPASAATRHCGRDTLSCTSAAGRRSARAWLALCRRRKIDANRLVPLGRDFEDTP
jgi:hypothetical protein